MKVLIAEDNAVSRQLLETRLAKWGYEVLVAKDGSEAWEILQRKDAPVLAILDWMMPEVDGVELCRRVRYRVTKFSTYLILLMTGDQKDDIVYAQYAGADDFITKPPHPSELHARVRAGRRVIELQERLIESQEALWFQTTHDGLTGFWNRSTVLNMLEREFVRAQRKGSPIGIAIADLDYFKSVNDTYGHVAGDTVLREVAERMLSAVRPYDNIGRYGGEEFLIVLPGSDEKETVSIAERIRSRICAKAVSLPDGIVPLTISLGAAVMDPTKMEVAVDSLIQAADRALYAAKAQGRNRTILSSSAVSENVVSAGDLHLDNMDNRRIAKVR